MEEPLRRGASVTLADGGDDTVGRILSLTEDGRRAEVRWHRPHGGERHISVEDTAALRRVHESELPPKPEGD